jgi:RNA polymerase sigma factor (sigma-70 family)
MFGPRLNTEADQDRFLLKIHEAVVALARRKVKNDDPDDVAHDITVSCLARLRSGEWTHEPENFDAFVESLVKYCAANRLRKRKSDMEHDAEHLRDRQDSTPEWMQADRSRDEASMEELRKTLIEKLPVHCRSSYRLVREEGRSYNEAAAILGLSANTVHNHIVDAQRVLRGELRAEGIPVAYSPRGGKPRGGRWRSNKVRLTPLYLLPEPAKTDREPVGVVR